MLNPIAALRQLVLPRPPCAPAGPRRPSWSPSGGPAGPPAVGKGAPPLPRHVRLRPGDAPGACSDEFRALLRRREPDDAAAPNPPPGPPLGAMGGPGAPAPPPPGSHVPGPSPAALQELWPALVRRVAWEGDGRRACVRLELGAGALAGATVLLTYDEGRVRVALDHPAHADLDAWRARIGARLVAAGLPVSEVE